LSITIVKAPGADKFIYKKTLQSVETTYNYDFKTSSWKKPTQRTSQERTLYNKQLYPLDKNSATGATTHLGYWMQDLLTYKINDPDSITIGKMMTYSKTFSTYMTEDIKMLLNGRKEERY